MNNSKTETNQQNTTQWIISATKPYHGMVLFISFLAIVSAVVSLWSALIIKHLIDAAVNGDKTLLTQNTLILALVLAATVGFNLLSRYLRERASNN